MKYSDIEKAVIMQAVCQYGIQKYKAFICKSLFFPGSGDYEDSQDVFEDSIGENYCICYEDFMNEGYINAGGGWFSNLDEAVDRVESDVCFKNWIR